jgi:hypothetical protein
LVKAAEGHFNKLALNAGYAYALIFNNNSPEEGCNAMIRQKITPIALPKSFVSILRIDSMGRLNLNVRAVV